MIFKTSTKIHTECMKYSKILLEMSITASINVIIYKDLQH